MILSTLLGGAALLFFLSTMAQSILAPDNGQDAHWLLSLFLNLLGYATIFLPGYYVIQYVRNSGYLDMGPSSLLSPLVRLCVQGTEYDNLNEDVPAEKEKKTEAEEVARLVYKLCSCVNSECDSSVMLCVGQPFKKLCPSCFVAPVLSGHMEPGVISRRRS